MQDYSERLRYANETITLIERARRQERRLQRAYRRMRNRQDSIDLASAGTEFAPPGWVAAETQFSDQLSFLILALRQVLRGDLGSTSGTGCLMRSWRNVEERWYDPAKGQPIRVLAASRLESDEVEPGTSHSGAEKAGLGVTYWREAVEARKEGSLTRHGGPKKDGWTRAPSRRISRSRLGILQTQRRAARR